MYERVCVYARVLSLKCFDCNLLKNIGYNLFPKKDILYK